MSRVTRGLLVGSLVAAIGGLGVVIASLTLGDAATGGTGGVVPPSAAAAPRAPVEAAVPSGEATEVDPGWVADVAKQTGIPVRALEAYASAAHRMSREQPGCGLGWNTLAGIGFVESEHGTISGGAIGQDGVASPPIIGIPLDGVDTEAIPDTDGGELDGDPVWDRAVGPMQFIPSTWAVWASDGNGDGVRDPQNIDDAAYSAARYLCAAGGDLTDPEGWIAAVDAYNHSVDYNNRVADAANSYASRTG